MDGDRLDAGFRRSLAPAGQTGTIGPETGRAKRRGIARFVSKEGSYRYVYFVNGEAVSVLQVMSRDGKHGAIATVYTLPAWRRKGLAKKLLVKARKDFVTVDHSQADALTQQGEAWSQAVGEVDSGMAKRPIVSVSLRRGDGTLLYQETKSALNSGIRDSEAAVGALARSENTTYHGERPSRVADVYTRRWVSPGGAVILATVSKASLAEANEKRDPSFTSAPTQVPVETHGPRVHKGDTYEGRLRKTLIDVGVFNPDAMIAATGDFWKRCEAAGVDPQVCAMTIYGSERHSHTPIGTTLKERAMEGDPSAMEAPTRSEWEVVAFRSRGASVSAIVAAAGRKPDEITHEKVVFGDIFDDEKARELARKLTNAGFMTTYGPRSQMAAAERIAYRWAEIYFSDITDAQRFASLLEKKAHNLGTYVGGTQHGATVTTNAAAGDIQKVLKKHRWKGSYSLSANALAAELAPVLSECNEAAPVLHEGAAEGSKKIPWSKVQRDPERHAEFAKTAQTVKTPTDVYLVVGPDLMAETQEVFVLLPLDIHGKMMCPPYEIARGQRDRVTVGIDNVMDAASDARCAGFIVAHNHPGGTAKPSKADIALTKEIKASTPKGRTFLDHVVVTQGCAYSIVEDRSYKIKA